VKLTIFIVKSVVFVLILWISSYVLAKTLDRTFVKDRSNKEMWTLSQRDLSVGYVIAGDSRAFNNIDAKTLERMTGQPSINIGFGGQSITDTYLTLYLFLKHNNHARNVILPVDGVDLDDTLKFQAHLYVPFISDPEVDATVRDVIGLKRYAVLKAFPIAKYWEYNNVYGLERLLRTRSGLSTSTYDESGGSELLYDDTYHVFPTNPRETDFLVDPRSHRYLDRIVQLVKSRGINLTIFSAPMYQGEGVFKEYKKSYRSYVARYCQQQNIAYLDFTDANFDRSEFRDYHHLNGRGALRFTQMLADSLTKVRHNASQDAEYNLGHGFQEMRDGNSTSGEIKEVPE
jgi:hypothetical protein